VVASPALRRWLWGGVAAAAVAALAALALTGHRPEPGLARFEAAGVMVAIPVDQVTAVDVRAADRHWRFERADTGWGVGAGSPAPAADYGAQVDAALQFLHATAPQRRLPAAELETTYLADFGLDPPRYVVSVRTTDARVLAVAFGIANPQGLAQYAQVGAGPDVVLLPRYVGEAWESATGLR
jgi:hypothetical protein